VDGIDQERSNLMHGIHQPRGTFRTRTACLAVVAVAAIVVATGVGLWRAEVAAGGRLDRAMRAHAAHLLPGGTIDHVEVTDDPALLAERRERIQQAYVRGTTAGGDPALLIVHQSDLDGGRSDWVDWSITVGALDGFTRVGDVVHAEWLRSRVDESLEVRLGASWEGDELVVAPAAWRRDGAPLDAASVPAAIRDAAVRRVAFPWLAELGARPGDVTATAHGVVVTLRADDVEVP
jgi:hypothetical protein